MRTILTRCKILWPSRMGGDYERPGPDCNTNCRRCVCSSKLSPHRESEERKRRERARERARKREQASERERPSANCQRLAISQQRRGHTHTAHENKRGIDQLLGITSTDAGRCAASCSEQPNDTEHSIAAQGGCRFRDLSSCHHSLPAPRAMPQRSSCRDEDQVCMQKRVDQEFALTSRG